jgi:hypothetical protein
MWVYVGKHKIKKYLHKYGTFQNEKRQLLN